MSDMSGYIESVRKGITWLVAQQNADGSVGPPEHVAHFCYKSPNALAMAGHVVEANRLLEWMKGKMLDADGELRAGAGPGAATYRLSWITLAAHRLMRFDISAPFLRWLAARQAPCGGFGMNVDSDHVETICAWAGMAALYAGHVDVATRVAAFVASMLDQQPDPNRFYHSMTLDGKLRTEGADVLVMDTSRPAQGYYNVGIPMLLASRLYLATGDPAQFDTARRLYAFAERCADDAHRHTSSAKSGVAAAVLASITGERAMRDRAVELADFLVSIQDDDGSWTVAGDPEVTIRIDATAEFSIFLMDIAATLGARGRWA